MAVVVRTAYNAVVASKDGLKFGIQRHRGFMNTTNPRNYRQTVWVRAVIISLLAALVSPFLSAGQAAQPAVSKESTKTKSVEQPEKDAKEVLEKIKTKLPIGWSVKSDKNIVTVSRDKPIEWYGTISLPSLGRAELKAQGFVHSGHYTITLEFFPPMSKSAIDKLIEANRRIEDEYDRKHPQPKNSKPLGPPKDMRDSMHHIPNILSDRYNVLLIPFIQGPGEAFFDEQEKKECEGVEQEVRRLLKSDEAR
jgi:hypothetical protein